MNVLVLSNKRNSYMVDSSVLRSGKNPADMMDDIFVIRDGKTFIKVQGENRYRFGDEVIERGVTDDLAACAELLPALVEEFSGIPVPPAAAPVPAPVPVPVPAATHDMSLGAVTAALAAVKEEQIFSKVVADLDAFIAEKYGKLPQKEIVVRLPDGAKRSAGTVVHERFETVLKMISLDIPVYMAGAAGTGKSSIAKQAADALGLDFYFTGAVSDIYKLTGFVDAHGKYSETQFYRFCVDGGVFFLDEVDASIPEVLVAFNAAIANRYFDFPCGKVELNPACRFVCAGNTYGSGADATYTGRYQLDGASLDRFAVIDIDYSKDIFLAVADGDKSLIDFLASMRKICKEISAYGYIFSYRCAANMKKMLAGGIPVEDALQMAVVKGMPTDTARTIAGKLKSGNKYSDAFIGMFA